MRHDGAAYSNLAPRKQEGKEYFSR
jgi:hypothetical protein